MPLASVNSSVPVDPRQHHSPDTLATPKGIDRFSE
jgi:hypothetical protein